MSIDLNRNQSPPARSEMKEKTIKYQIEKNKGDEIGIIDTFG